MAIGTTAALIGASIGGSVASAAIGSRAAGKAADAQSASAANQVQLQRQIYDQQSENFAPFLGSGQNALSALNFELGLGERPTFGGNPLAINEIQDTATREGSIFNNMLRFSEENRNGRYNTNYGPRTTTRTRFDVGGNIFDSRDAATEYANANPTGGTEYQGFQATPGYDFRLNQGLDAVEASAATRGGINSGATLQALNQYGQDYASGEYNNYINRLTGLASSGQNAAGQQAAAGSNFATGASNALAAGGNAQSAGYIGQANAINAGIGNTIGAFQYQNALAGGGATGPDSLFRGSWGL